MEATKDRKRGSGRGEGEREEILGRKFF